MACQLFCCRAMLEHMFACSGNICDALCCCFSYHMLLNLKYESQTAKTTATKKLDQETGISVREVERCLDSNVFQMNV